VARSLTWAQLTSQLRCPHDQETTATGNRKKKKRTALNQIGTRVRVNEIEVTLFRMGSIVFATQEACQHMGGPLSLGDIEVRARSAHAVAPVA
jgi:nitrite reductase/ring-hydroxylating ferredoxin subunit